MPDISTPSQQTTGSSERGVSTSCTRGAADVASLRGRRRPALPAGRGRSRHVIKEGPAGACEERSCSDRDDTNPLINKRPRRCGRTGDRCDDLSGSNALGYRAPNYAVDSRERCITCPHLRDCQVTRPYEKPPNPWDLEDLIQIGDSFQVLH